MQVQRNTIEVKTWPQAVQASFAYWQHSGLLFFFASCPEAKREKAPDLLDFCHDMHAVVVFFSVEVHLAS